MTPTLARRYTIAGLQIFGGLYGFAGTAQILVSVDSWLARLVDLVILMFFVLCFAAGMLLYRDHDWGASLSLYLQVPQLVFVYSSTLIFNVFGGLSASLSLTTPLSIKLNLTPGFSAYFSLLNDLDHITLGVNLVAVVTLWQLLVYLDAKDNPQPPDTAPSRGGMV